MGIVAHVRRSGITREKNSPGCHRGQRCNVKSRENNRRTPTQRTRAKTPRLPDAQELGCVQANPRFARAYTELAKRQIGQWAGQDLSGPFAVRACLVVLPVPSSRNWREDVWLNGASKSWKALTEFPDRLNKIAEEIETLNAKFLAIPENCKNPFLVKHIELPTALRTYGEALRHRTAGIVKGFAAPSSSRRIVELLNFSTAMTGRDRVKDCAELLNGAAEALGREPKFDATHLIQARSRYRGPCAYYVEKRRRKN